MRPYRFSPRGYAALTVAVVLMAALPAMAQGTTAPQLQSWSIAAGPLDETLLQIAARSGRVITATPALLEGLRAPAVSGDMSVEQALDSALAGSGLEWSTTANGTYTLRKQPEARGATVLAPVKVQATVDSTVTEGSGSLTTQGPVSAATGLGLTLRETPQSVTVVTRERIEQQNLNSLAEVAEQVTGVFFNTTGTPIGGRSQLTARGYTINSYQVDSVNLPWEALGESFQYGHGALDTAIYDSITVVRGSTGLMTGAGEPSALIALTRKKPTQQLQTSLEATVGSWNRYRAMVDVGGPLNASGSVRGRLVGAYDEGETWVDDYSSDRSIVYGVLEMDLSPQTLLTLTLEHGNADSEQAPWAFDYGLYFYFADRVTPIPPSTTTNIGAPWAYLNSDRTFASAALAHQFNADWSAKLSYAYGQYNTAMRRGMVRSIPADGSRTAARVLDLDYSYDTHIFDVRVDGKYALFGRQHEVVAGLNLYRFDQAAPLGVYSDPVADLAYWNGRDVIYDTPDWDALAASPDNLPFDAELNQESAYLATRLRPLDRLAVILGGRLTNWDTLSADRETANNPYFVWDDRQYDNEFTPYAGVVFDITRALSAYASYTRIFLPQSAEDIDGRLLDPEEGDTYEIGLKGAWFEDRLNASVAAFESRRENLAVALVDENGPILNPNGNEAFIAADDTKGRGWEIEVSGALTPRWQIQAGYSHFKNKDSSGVVLDTTQPVQQFKLYTAYQPAFVPNLTVGGSLRWQSDTYVDGMDDPLYGIDSYFVVGANLGYVLNEQLSFSVAINNVLDEEYRVANYSYSYGAPRNATFTVRARF